MSCNIVALGAPSINKNTVNGAGFCFLFFLLRGAEDSEALSETTHAFVRHCKTHRHKKTTPESRVHPYSLQQL